MVQSTMVRSTIAWPIHPLFAYGKIRFDGQRTHECEELFRLTDEESVRGEGLERSHGSAIGRGGAND
jgi:hypothetical protein